MLIFFVGLYLLSNVAIGLWASKRVKNASDFALAGRQLSVWIAGTSIFATWFGSETIMSSSVEFAEGGFLAVIKDPFGAALCLLLIGLFFIRPIYRLNVVTFSDYFRLRFGRKAELLSAFIMSLTYLAWIAAQLQAIGIIISVIAETGGIQMSVMAGTIIGSVLIALYTFVGGMWAVSITDFVQTIVILLGLLFICYNLWSESEGLLALAEAQPDGFFRIYPSNVETSSVISYIEAWIVVGLGSIPQQDVFQRALSTKSAKTGVNAVYLSALMYITIGMLPLFVGLAGKVLYPELLTGHDNQALLPQIVIQNSPIVVQILFFGALVSAIMSTASGALLAPATIITENIIKPLNKNMSDRAVLKTLRLTVLFSTILSFYMATGGSSIYELAAQASSSTLVSLFVPLVAGIYWKRASKEAAMASMLVGSFVWLVHDNFYTDTFLLPSMMTGTIASIVTLIIVSIFIPNQEPPPKPLSI